MNNDRSQFEAWAKPEGFGLRLQSDPGADGIGETLGDIAHEYHDEVTQFAWEAWQAARAWRPISEAPRDGAMILLYWSGGPVVGHYVGENSGWRVNWNGLPAISLIPTHWQPMPPEPQP